MAGAHSMLTDRPVFKYTWEYYFTRKFDNGRVWVSFQLVLKEVRSVF